MIKDKKLVMRLNYSLYLDNKEDYRSFWRQCYKLSILNDQVHIHSTHTPGQDIFTANELSFGKMDASIICLQCCKRRMTFGKKILYKTSLPTFNIQFSPCSENLPSSPPKKWNLGSLQFDNFLNVSIQATMKMQISFLF